MHVEGSQFLTDTYHIVGDKAFPLSEHILTPYKKSKRRSRTRAQKIYNKHLASKRQVSSSSFQLLILYCMCTEKNEQNLSTVVTFTFLFRM